MDKYHCSFDITTIGDRANWELRDHKNTLIAMGPTYSNWHNAKRALDRHIKVLQSGNFTLPPKPLRKEYTFKSQSHVPQN